MVGVPSLTALSLGLCAVALLALLEAERRQSWVGKAVFKPMASLGFIGVAAGRVLAGDPVDRGLLVALGLGLLGDVLLIPRGRAAFVGGMMAFMAGHLAYAALFLRRGVELEAVALAGVAMAVLAGLELVWLARNMADRALWKAVVVYGTTLSAMVAFAVGAWAQRGPPTLLAGALLFFVSDAFVARNRLVKPAFVNRLFGLPLYYAGQCLLAWSV